MKSSEPRGWIKGQSGHPKGRCIRAKSWPDLLQRIGRERVVFEDDGDVTCLSREERLARTLWTRALDGDLKAAQMLLADMKAPVNARNVTATMTLTLEDLAGAARLEMGRGAPADAEDAADNEAADQDDAEPPAG